MEREFIYEKETAPCGVAVETIYGADEKTVKVWKLFAMQIFSEADGDYRAMEHLACGAPILDGIPQRISVSHTTHCLVVASLPKTPDIALDQVNARTAIGIDIEKGDRAQVVKIRDKFLSTDEKELVPAVEETENATENEIRQHILAWTCKEALYKAGMGDAPDWKEDYRIISLPRIASSMKEATQEKYGRGLISTSEGEMDMWFSSWMFEGQVVTLAFSTKIAKFSA